MCLATVVPFSSRSFPPIFGGKLIFMAFSASHFCNRWGVDDTFVPGCIKYIGRCNWSGCFQSIFKKLTGFVEWSGGRVPAGPLPRMVEPPPAVVSRTAARNPALSALLLYVSSTWTKSLHSTRYWAKHLKGDLMTLECIKWQSESCCTFF